MGTGNASLPTYWRRLTLEGGGHLLFSEAPPHRTQLAGFLFLFLFLAWAWAWHCSSARAIGALRRCRLLVTGPPTHETMSNDTVAASDVVLPRLCLPLAPCA